MYAAMVCKVVSLAEILIANVATEGIFPRVHAHVPLKAGRVAERFAALKAGEFFGSLPSVCLQVPLESGLVKEGATANGADHAVGLIAFWCVYHLVALEVAGAGEGFVALRTAEWPLSGVHAHVTCQMSLVQEGLIALIAASLSLLALIIIMWLKGIAFLAFALPNTHPLSAAISCKFDPICR